jgi:hypothetical protein
MVQDQPSGTVTVAGGGGTAPADPAIASHIQTIVSHLSVSLGDATRVEDAYRSIEVRVGDDGEAESVLLRLASLLRETRSRAAPTLFRLLSARVVQLERPGALLAALLAARSPALRAEAVAVTLDAVLAGRLVPDLDLATAVAHALPGGTGDDIPPEVAQLLARVEDPRLPLHRGEPLGRLLEPSVPLAVRLVAARLLDADGEPAPEQRIRRVLGATANKVLGHHLAFTRATHGDLVALTPGPSPRVQSQESIRSAEAVLGRDRLALVLAQLGWSRVSDHLSAEAVTVLRADGSFPLVLAPCEAALVERRATSSARWSGWVVTARGTEEATAVAVELDVDRVARFRRLSLNHALLLAEIMEVAPVPTSRGRRVLELMDRVVADHVALFEGLDVEAAAVPEVYAELRRGLAQAVDEAATPATVLAMDVAYQIQAFEDPPSVQEARTLHGLKRYLHQRGLNFAFKLFGSGGAANRTADLMLVRDGQPPALIQKIRYLDFEEEEGGGVPLAVRLVIDAFRAHLVHGLTDLPGVRVLVYGTEVQFYVTFRNHPAFIRLDLSPPRRGGMIDLEYYAVSQYELAEHPDLGVSGIQAVLRRLGFFVELDGTRLRARYDKERAVEVSDIVEKAAMLMRVVPHLMELDWRLAARTPQPAERRELAERWADFLERHGILPPADAPLPGTAGRDLVRRIRHDLRRAGIRLPLLTPGPAGAGVGQRDLERGILEPLRALVERGEVLVRDGEVLPAPRYGFRQEHEAARLARILAWGGKPLREAIHTAAVLRPMERWLRFVPVGTIQGYPVERATLVLRDGDVTVAVLRDDRGRARVAFAARGATPYRVRAGRPPAWRRPAELRLPALMRLLVRDNYRSLEQEPPREVELDRVADVRALLARRNPRPPVPPVPGERIVPALPAAPGRASGIVRMAQPGRSPEDFDGAVFVAPTIQPSDSPYLAWSVAAVSTGGGSLSHVGLLALELGKPSVIVRGRWRRNGPSSRVLVLQRTELRARTGTIGSLEVRCWTRVRECDLEVREGDLVVVDPDSETLSVLGSDREALVLHQGFRDLDSASRAVGAAREDGPLLDARGALLRVTHQLDRALYRLDRTALARYAVRELFAGQAAPDAGHATRERRALLDILCRSPILGDAAREARDEVVVALLHQLRDAVRIARAVIPELTQPLPVLLVRLTAARLRESLRSVADMEMGLPDGRLTAGQGAAEPVMEELDSLAAARLGELWRGLVEEVESLLAAGRPGSPLHHALRAMELTLEAAPSAEEPAGQEVLTRARALARTDLEARRAAVGTRLIVGWDETGMGTEAVVGRKAANLGEVARALRPGMVPPWFVITDRAYHRALESPVREAPAGTPIPLQEAIDHVLARRELDSAGKFACIRNLWLNTRFPTAVEEEIVAGYRALTDVAGAPPSVAIRSSAAEEDAPTGTWAGQFDTFLHITGEATVLRHVRLAWAALWSPRALMQRERSCDSGSPGGGGIMVQRMVESRVAGVVLTVDAAAGEMRELVVNVGLGLGQGIVSGTVDADEIHVIRTGRRGEPLQLRYRVADKRERCVFDTRRGAGTRRVETLFHQRFRPAMEYTELEALVAAALKLERVFREPLDLEFALEGSSLFILQARPLPLFRTVLVETARRYPLKERMP